MSSLYRLLLNIPYHHLIGDKMIKHLKTIFLGLLLRIMPNKMQTRVINKTYLPDILESTSGNDFMTRMLEGIGKIYNPVAGQKYKNTEEEVNEVLQTFPPLAPYKAYLFGRGREDCLL